MPRLSFKCSSWVLTRYVGTRPPLKKHGDDQHGGQQLLEEEPFPGQGVAQHSHDHHGDGRADKGKQNRHARRPAAAEQGLLASRMLAYASAEKTFGMNWNPSLITDVSLVNEMAITSTKGSTQASTAMINSTWSKIRGKIEAQPLFFHKRGRLRLDIFCHANDPSFQVLSAWPGISGQAAGAALKHGVVGVQLLTTVLVTSTSTSPTTAWNKPTAAVCSCCRPAAPAAGRCPARRSPNTGCCFPSAADRTGRSRRPSRRPGP